MNIGGIERCSFIDFPGRLSAVVFFHGCNLRCGYCHNPALVEGPNLAPLDEAEVLDFLMQRRDCLGGVVLSGGEPTLQPGIAEFARRVREMGFRLKLDTNGTRPDALRDLLDRRLLDFVALDFKDLPEQLPLYGGCPGDAERFLESLDLIRRAGLDHELRTTAVLPRHTSARLDAMARLVRPGERWLLQKFRPARTLRPSEALCPIDEAHLAAEAARLKCGWR